MLQAQPVGLISSSIFYDHIELQENKTTTFSSWVVLLAVATIWPSSPPISLIFAQIFLK